MKVSSWAGRKREMPARTWMEGRVGQEKEMERANSPVQYLWGMILWRYVDGGRGEWPFVGEDGRGISGRGCSEHRCRDGGVRMRVIDERKSYDSEFSLGKTDKLGMHIWTLLVAIKQAQRTVMRSPAPIFPPPTSFEPNQNPWTNIAIVANCAAATRRTPTRR